MSDKPASSDVEYARQLQEKFELYLLGLIFTLLALAIQTAKFGTDDIADVFEIVGWLCLLASGLVGLSRIEWVPVTLQTHSELLEIKTELSQLQDDAARGLEQVPVVDQAAPADIAALIADRTGAIARIKTRVESLEVGVRRKYRIHKWSFVCGLVLLVAARSFGPVQSLAKKHLTLHSSGPPSAAAHVKG